MSLLVRNLVEQDLDTVLVLAADSLEAPHWNRRDYQQIILAEASDRLLRCGLIADNGGKVAGFAVASWLRQEPAAEVEGLFVELNCRRHGVGSALIAACMAWAAKAGASAVRLEVRASNTAAHALYRRYGFSTAGVRRAYYSAPVEDALLLQAPLFPRASVPL
ncbi:MAG: GNAT family N-acetyltransferase [Acidobacteriaceae bacterium]